MRTVIDLNLTRFRQSAAERFLSERALVEIAADGQANTPKSFSPSEVDAQVQELHAKYRQYATRRIADVELGPNAGLFAGRRFIGPALLGEPRPTSNRDGWRRAFLVELLDGFPVSDATRPTSYRAVADADIAVVSLLLRFDGLSNSELSSSPGVVLNAERKAIGLSRARRGLLTPLIRAGRELSEADE